MPHRLTAGGVEGREFARIASEEQLAGSGENAAATGDLDLTGALTVAGASASSTIVDGQSLDRVFDAI